MKILFLAQYYAPEMGGASARLTGLSRWLAAQGHEVTVITSFPNYPSGVFPPEYKGKWSVRESYEQVDLIRMWVYASPKRSGMRRLANYFSFVLTSLIGSFSAGRGYDVVIASSPPLFLGISGWLVGLFRRIPFVFDIRDIWPDVAVEAGEFDEDALITRAGAALARFLYRRATHITPVTENKRLKIKESGISDNKQTVVTNGVDLDLVPPLDETEDKREELGLSGKFVIVYAGLLGIAQGVDIAVHAANQLRETPDIHFLIVGDGVCKEDIAKQVADLKLTNVTMLPRQPKEAIPAFLKTADVSLVPLVSSNLADAVPSKLLEAWAFQRPAILAAGGEAADIVRRSGGGLVVAPEERDQLAPAIMQLYQNQDEARAMAQQGHAYVKENFDRPMLAQQMAAVFQKLL